jgi:hypothetical protein
MLSEVPKGYKVVHRMANEFGAIQEFIPEGETLLQWTEMLTVQILRHQPGYVLSDFRAALEGLWCSMCPGSSSEFVEAGFEQLRPTLMWSMICPLNRMTGKPELTWIKIVMGDGKLIVVQKAFKFKPSAEAIAFWISYLREVRVNDDVGCPAPARRSRSRPRGSRSH